MRTSDQPGNPSARPESAGFPFRPKLYTKLRAISNGMKSASGLRTRWGEVGMLKSQGDRLGGNDSLDRMALADRYAGGGLTPTRVVEGVLERIAARGDDKVWIRVFPRE